MIIALDVMGGDYAPLEIIKGAQAALASQPELELILVGDEAVIRLHWALVDQEPRVRIRHCTEVIHMNEHPAMAYRKKKDASITVATKCVKSGEAAAVVSAGSTGAQMVAALFVLGRLQGVLRPAIGSFIPTLQGPRFMLDVGANMDSQPENLLQFAWLGHIYAENALGVSKPAIYLLSNGTEAEKGDDRTQKAHQLLLREDKLNFCGNIEGRDILKGQAQVIVCDGFAGNVALKTMEGTAEALFTLMKEAFLADGRSKVGAYLLKPALKNVKKHLDYEEYGGAPLLGVDGISVVCHGSSKARAIESAIIKTMAWVQSGYLAKLKEHSFAEA
jgi:glycerol-3-phosphate acyltransferase PlsX